MKPRSEPPPEGSRQAPTDGRRAPTLTDEQDGPPGVLWVDGGLPLVVAPRFRARSRTRRCWRRVRADGQGRTGGSG